MTAADTTMNKPRNPQVNGVLVVNKPAGPTSHDVVAIVRRLTGVKRVGHGGTLDPFASGVLPVFLGNATRIVEYHMADEKGYRAAVVFGARSSTDDLDGELTPGEGTPPTRESVETTLERFRGQIEQIPPAHSAVRVAGRHAYELARHGERPQLKPRNVEIHHLALTEWQDHDERPIAILEVRCSAGTYIRALARDLGEALGTGAYLGALTRTASGPFRIEESHPLDEVRTVLADGRVGELLLAPDTGLTFPSIVLAPDELGLLARGQNVRSRLAAGARPGPDGLLRVLDEAGRLAAIGRLESGLLRPQKVLLSSASATNG
jgi:tRNA pseudouridine55 synthase